MNKATKKCADVQSAIAAAKAAAAKAQEERAAAIAAAKAAAKAAAEEERERKAADRAAKAAAKAAAIAAKKLTGAPESPEPVPGGGIELAPTDGGWPHTLRGALVYYPSDASAVYRSYLTNIAQITPDGKITMFRYSGTERRKIETRGTRRGLTAFLMSHFTMLNKEEDIVQELILDNFSGKALTKLFDKMFEG